MSTTALRDDMTAGVVNAPVGYAQYTDNSAVRHLDDTPATGKRLSTTRGRPNKMLVSCTGQAIRWVDDDDITPSSTIGMPLAVGATLEYDGDLARFRWIEAVAGAVVNISYYRG